LFVAGEAAAENFSDFSFLWQNRSQVECKPLHSGILLFSTCCAVPQSLKLWKNNFI
jgi:hypothetical protein